MELHRQELPPPRKPPPPQRVPETSPPLLGDWFIYLSVVILVCGVIAISALELGTAPSSWLVRGPAFIGAALLVIVSTDAALRTWRSAWAWLPVDRGRGLFRFIWAAVLVAILLASLAVIVVLITL